MLGLPIKFQRPPRRVLTAVVIAAVTGAGLLLATSGGLRPLLVQLAGWFGYSQSFTVTTPIRLLDQPSVSIESGTVTMNGVEDQPAAEIALKTENAGELELDDAVVVIDVGDMPAVPGQRPGTAGPDSLGPDVTARIIAALRKHNIASVSIRDSSLVIKTGENARTVFNAMTTTLSSSNSGTISAVGALTYLGEKLSFSANLGPDNTDPAIASAPLKIALKGDILEFATEGTLTLGAMSKFSASSANLVIPDLRAVARWLYARWPDGPGIKPFRAKGAMIWTSHSLAFEDAQFALDGNEATGALAFMLSGEKPVIEGTLAFGTLDLTGYKAAGTDPDAPKSVVEQHVPLLSYVDSVSLPLLAALNADVRISADRIDTPALTLKHAAALVSLQNKKLSIELAETEFGAATRGSADLVVDATAEIPQFQVKAHLNDVELGDVALMLFGRPLVSGPGSAEIELSGTGTTPAELLASANGRVNVTASSQLSFNFGLKRLAGAGSAKAGVDTWQLAVKEATALERFEAALHVTYGVVIADLIQGGEGEHSFEAQGGIDLRAEQIQMLFFASEPGPATRVATRVQQQWTALEISGPLRKPALKTVPATRRVMEPPVSTTDRGQPKL